ncbi:MAG: hypothetical protein A2Z83_09330 [Omnitrophica bacterium GWA2_52_8]|nr:MAG: hypothetical protein A2Z83_09330 [Omnitrophica bacterium GWA2_52_8]
MLSFRGAGVSDFVWDPEKEALNLSKHGINFSTAAGVFKDPRRKIFKDIGHSGQEERFYCIGCVAGRILTVRFTYRERKIRIIGAGFWRKGRSYYEEEEC